MAASTEERELELVERVDLRILNVANQEKRLQELLSKFLVPLLLKGASEHASVRAKVATVAQRLRVFIQPPGIVLPVAGLVQQFKSTESAVVRHLDMVFIQHSIGRLSADARRAVVPALLAGISQVNTSTPALFSVFLQTLSDVKVPPRGSKEDGAFRQAVGLGEAADAAYVADWLGKLFLLSKSASIGSSADAAFLQFEQEDGWLRTGSHLAETRMQAASFLASGAFTDEERFMAALYASGHADSRVSTAGEELLKRSAVSLEDAGFVRQLFQAHAVLPAGYRIRILQLLSRSALSATYADEILAVVERDTDPAGLDMDEAAATAAATRPRLERTKLAKALFGYIHWIARMAAPQKTFAIGRPLIDHLQQFIVKQGWPVPTAAAAAGGTDFIPLRAQAYETMGLLAKGAQMRMAERVALASWLFRSLAEDPTGAVVVHIDGALSSMTSLFLGQTEEDSAEAVFPQLRAMLLKYVNLSEDEQPHIRRSARHAAAKWANQCLPFADPVARWIDIVAVAGHRGERSDVVEEGRRGLDPWTYHSRGAQQPLPRWPEMVRLLFKRPIGQMVLALAADAVSPASQMDVDGLSLFVNFGGERLAAFPVAANYCKQLLFLAALADRFKVEPGWEQQLATLVQSDQPSRDAIRAYLRGLDDDGRRSLGDLLAASFEGMLRPLPTLAEPCGRCFVEVASLAPREATAPLASRAGELLALVRSNKKEMRQIGAAAVGILGAHPDRDDASVAALKQQLVEASQPWETAVGSELNASEGAFVALSHLLSRLVFYDAARAAPFVADAASLFPTAAQVTTASTSFQDAIFDSLAQLWTVGLACLPGAADAADRSTTIKVFVELLQTQAKKGNERAIGALGRLAMATGSDEPNPDDPTQTILEVLYGLYELRQVEVHFAVGGAITAAVAGWDADVVTLSLDVVPETSMAFRVSKRPVRLAAALDKILTDCKTTKPALLKASGIWLFSLIQHSAHLPEIQSRLRACQAAFMRLLSARDELVQETASRGLALVYEKGDTDLKEALVRDLVASFTGSTTTTATQQLKVEEETELFEAGALPTGDGRSVTSYKDIVSLANEAGDPSLVYKFMSLAANAATWSTRSAFGRFGLSSILSASEVDPKLYPKLFRYRFDPNPNVQRSMNDIWKALVPDPVAVLDAHLDAILADLLASILGREWRVRQASCAALADLVQGRPFAQYAARYEAIWAKALKVLDDVKASVRGAALQLCAALANTLVRQLESGDSSASAAAMMRQALPFLLSEQGIESGVEDVKVFATITVLKVAKHGGAALRPYLADLVCRLLGLLSTIEPQALNYYYLRSGEADKEKLDKMRSAMVSQSPISEAIDDGLRSVDAGVMADLAPGLEAVIKTAVGMPTKIGCGRVLATLATRHAADLAPHAARLLRLLEKQLLDRNDEVSQSYAKAAAYLVRVAPDDARARFAARLVDLYLAAEDDARRQKVADAVLALSKISPDHFAALESALLPLTYLASHDTDDYVHKAADEVWGKHAGTRLSVARYLDEIAGLVRRALDTPQWALRHGAALTAADAVRAILGASDLAGRVNLAHLRALWPLYQQGLALKTFAGKEQLLDVLPDLVTKGRALWADDPTVAAALHKMALVEAKRNNAAYRVHAFRCLGRVAAARDDVALWDDLVAIVVPHLAALDDDAESADRMDVDSGKNRDEEKLRRQTAESALEAVAQGYFRPAMKQDPSAVLAAVWDPLAPFLTSPAFGLVRRVTWYKAAAELFQAAAAAAAAADVTSAAAGAPALLSYLGSLDASTPEVGTEDQRSARVRAIQALGQAARKGAFGPASADALVDALSQVKAALQAAQATERSLDVQKLLKEAVASLS